MKRLCWHSARPPSMCQAWKRKEAAILLKPICHSRNRRNPHICSTSVPLLLLIPFPFLQETATLGDSLIILRTKYVPLCPGEGRDDIKAFFWKGLCPSFLLSFKFNFQIPVVERQGREPSHRCQSLEFWICLNWEVQVGEPEAAWQLNNETVLTGRGWMVCN